jgi:predicted lipid-binding transport protein (Tim44 family)
MASLIPAAVSAEAGNRANGSGVTLGGRGSRSDSAGVRRAPDRPKPELARAIAPAAVPARSGSSLSTLAGFAAGGLIAGSLVAGFGLDQGISLGFLHLLLGGSVAVLLIFFRRFQAAHARTLPTSLNVSTSVDAPADRTTTEEYPSAGSSLDQGIRDIRRTDPGFDPTRFAGYTGMVFRDAQAAWTTQDIHAVRDRVTPEMYVELQAQCSRLRKIGQADRVERIEITAEITEAWQESGRDYATANIDGSIVDYTVDEVTHSLIHGSRTVPRHIEEFWTFTRPAGLNFWMLSAIQTA